MTSPKKSPLPKPPDSTVELESLDGIWAELENDMPVYETPAIGDISKNMLAAKYNISVQAASERMKKLVETGKWKLVMVKLGYGTKPCMVIRKA